MGRATAPPDINRPQRTSHTGRPVMDLNDALATDREGFPDAISTPPLSSRSLRDFEGSWLGCALSALGLDARGTASLSVPEMRAILLSPAPLTPATPAADS